MSTRHRSGETALRRFAPDACPGSPRALTARSVMGDRGRFAQGGRCAIALAIGAVAATALPALADMRDQIGYTRLLNDFMNSPLTGAGVPVGQVEAFDGSGYYPSTETDPTTGAFPGKHFTLITSSTEPAVTFSGHGQFVGLSFYGSGAAAPGVHNIYAYSISSWYDSVLHNGQISLPAPTPARVVNHSYLDTFQVIGRTDWLIDTDDTPQVVAVNNGDSTSAGTGNGGLPTAMNTIGVGRSDGINVTGTEGAGGIYTGGRSAIMLVAPATATSFAAPEVAGVAATLIGAAHSSPALSHSSYVSPRTGATLYSGETSEVVKAMLMAGADRKSLTNYAVDTSNGLSSVYGAGQVNIYNSYRILRAGEQESSEQGNTRSIHRSGFDYQPAFTDQSAATYYFTGDLARRGIQATLAVNAKVGNPTATDPSIAAATLKNLSLSLYDLASPLAPVAQVGSGVDSTQTLSYYSLVRNHKYLLKVTPAAGQGSFTQDYGLAWRFTPSSTITSGYANGVTDLFYGDCNGDKVVDTNDFASFAANFGRPDGTWSDGDFNGDGVIDTLDFSMLASNFGGTLPMTPAIVPGSVEALSSRTSTASVAALTSPDRNWIVPEPTTLTLLGVIALPLVLRRRRNVR
jgi:hypothetical protein